MGLFGSGRGKAADWAPATLRLLESRRANPHPEGMSSTAFDALKDLVTDRGVDYTFLVEVRRDGHPPQQVAHSEKVPNSVVAPGLSSEQKIPAGIELGGWVRVDDPTVIAIDWTSYRGTPEAVAAATQARQVEVDEVYVRAVLSKTPPKQLEQMRANAWLATSGLAQAVRDGGDYTRAQWEEQAQGNLRRTLITPEQYDQALAILGGR